MADALRTLCPCGRQVPYPDCCGALHEGTRRAETAEDLMRSRYSAFVVGDGPYLLATWHPTTRPGYLDLDADTEWTRLRILETSAGDAGGTEGTVSFRAHYRTAGERGAQTETSRFVRGDDGAWLYLDGDVGSR